MTVWTASDSIELVTPIDEPQPSYSLIVGGGAFVGENLRCSEAEWGGFDTCTFDVKSDPRLSERGLTPLEDVAVDFLGESIFEGRVADIGKEVTTDEGGVRRVTCRGYFDVLKDDDALRRTYRNQDLTSWQDWQTDTSAGQFDILIDEDEVSIRQRDDLPYFVTNSARVVLQITGGVSITGEYIQEPTTITLTDDITGAGTDWEVSAFLRATPNGANQDAWTSPGDGTYTLDIESGGDLEPTTTTRCIVVRVKCITAATDFRFLGKAADSPHYGVAITAMDVRGSDADSMAPEDIVRDLIADYTTAAQRDFPDASGITVGQLDFSEATTRYDMVESVNELLRWQWGFGPGTVFSYREPWTAANVPGSHCYDLPYSLAAPNTTVALDDLWKACAVDYEDGKGHPKELRHSWTNSALPTGANTRRQLIQAPGHVHNATQAQQVADAFAADHAGAMPTGSVTLTGYVPLVNGSTRHACHIRPGEYVMFRDAPADEDRFVRITRVERSPDELSAVIEYGRNPNRLDKLLARWDAKTTRRRRRR